jgi:hypothetical protein
MTGKVGGCHPMFADPFLEGKTARSFGDLRMTMMGERRPQNDNPSQKTVIPRSPRDLVFTSISSCTLVL